MASFNFAEYVKCTAGVAGGFKVEPLAGGYTNEVVRVSFDGTSSPAVAGRRLPATVILKHAAPHLPLRAGGYSSSHRQAVEAEALEHLRTSNLRVPQLVPRIPQLIHYDAKARVLWITDRGAHVSLTNWIEARPPPSSSAIATVASELAACMSELYRATRNPKHEAIKRFARTGCPGPDNACSLAVGVAHKNLTAAGYPLDEVNVLVERVAESYTLPMANEGTCLGLVDFWSGCVLIHQDTEGSGRTSWSLIDWEKFGVSSTSRELGMFAAYLTIPNLASTATAASKRFYHHFASIFLSAFSPAKYDLPICARRLLLVYGAQLIAASTFGVEIGEDGARRCLKRGAEVLQFIGRANPNAPVDEQELKMPREVGEPEWKGLLNRWLLPPM